MMRFIICVCLVISSVTLSAQKIFIVRHAEKAAPGPNMTSDVPLSDKGKQRAEALREILRNEKIDIVYSTNTIRTKSTGQPTAELFGLTILTYGPMPDSAFAAQVRASGKNVLIVGHSNTVDDMVNLVLGKKKIESDLNDSEYSNLFVITNKDGELDFERKKYGED